MAKINIDVQAEAGRAISELGGVDKTLGRVQRSAKITGSVFKGALGANLVSAGLGKGLDAIAAGLDSVMGRAEEAYGMVKEQQKLAAQTDAVIKSTGGAAKVTADQISSLSDALEQKSLIDAEQIQNGSNLLLTFTKIRNEAGAGNDIFNRTTQAMTDLSTAMGQSTSASAVQLGKALNDPVKGVSALQKVGVSFTQQQKDQITTLQESGNILGAQKIILSELETQFGGSAAAAAGTFEGSIKRVNDTVDGLIEDGIKALIPAIEPVLDRFATALPGAIEKTKTGAQALYDLFVKGDFTKGFADTFGFEEDSDQVAGLFAIRDAALQIGPAVQAALVPVMESVSKHAGGMGKALSDGLAALGGGEGGTDLTARIKPIGEAVATVIDGASQLAQAVLPVVLQIGAAIGQAITDNLPAIQSAGSALASLGQSITSIWTTIGPTVLPIVESVFGTIVQVISGVVGLVADVAKSLDLVLKGDIGGALENSKAGFLSFVETVGGALVGNLLNQSKTMAVGIVKAITGVEVDADKAWADFPANMGKIWERIKAAVVQQAEGLRAATIGKVEILVASIPRRIEIMQMRLLSKWNAIKAVARLAWQAIYDTTIGKVAALVQSVPGRIESLRASIANGFTNAKNAASTALGLLASTVRSKIDEAVRFVQGLPGRATSALSGMGGRLVSAGGDLIRGFLNGMSNVIGSVAAKAREMAQSAVNAAKSALGIASPSKVFIELGKFVGQGLAIGVQGSRKDVDTAVKTLSDRMTAAFKEQATAARTASVAARTASVKRWQAEVKEAEKAQTKIAANNKRISQLNADQIAKARAAVRANEARQAVLQRGGITKAERAEYDRLRKAQPGLVGRLADVQRAKSALLAENKALSVNARALDQRAAKLRAAQDALARAQRVKPGDVAYARTQQELRQQAQLIRSLQVNAAARDKINAKLKVERDRLAELTKQRTDYAVSIKEAARQFANITAIEAPENTTATAATFTQGLRDRLNAILNFRRDLGKLAKLGVDATTYDQIVSAGVEGGSETLNALLAGGKTAVDQIAKLQRQINLETQSLGIDAGSRLYKAGVDAQAGLIKGLEADNAALERAAAKFASKLTTAVKRELGIRSPSRVFEALGGQTVAGLVQGLDADTVKRAGRSLARSVVAGYANPELTTSVGGRGAAGQTTIYLNVDVQRGVSPAEVGRGIISELQAYEQATGRQVLVRPGRRS